jgi:hypothetical protein
MSTPITTIPNRPANKAVFDFQIGPGLCRVFLSTVSNDGLNLVMTGWAYRIDADGNPVLDTDTATPIAGPDANCTVHLSGVLAGTHSLYDGWCKYVPKVGESISADNLPEGWTSGAASPTGTPAYGASYYDTAADQPWVYTQGCLAQAAQSFADALEAQIDTAAKLAGLGL